MDFTKAKGTASKLDREAKKCLKKNYLETKSQILLMEEVLGKIRFSVKNMVMQ